VSIEVVAFDAGGTPETAAQVAAEIAADETFVGAIAAPDLGGQAAIAQTLAAAGVPLISLSGRETVRGVPMGTWLRLVAPVREQAEALAETAAALRASRRGICIVTAPLDGTVYARAVRRALPPDVAVSEVDGAAAALESGCGVVLWTGGPEAGAELATALASSEAAPILLGGPALRDRQFLDLAQAAAEGAVSLCSCAEISTSLDLGAQRFIQDYQSEVGSPPGPYAVEAWDAAHLLTRAVRDAGPSRDEIVALLAETSTLEGLGGPYTFVGGELADPIAAIRRYRVEGGRWVAVQAR
jgi:branched-chain amino acid transport system substrate-binding protein